MGAGLRWPPSRELVPRWRWARTVAAPEVPDGWVVVVPIPSHRRAVRRRGHDPLWEIVRVAVQELRGAGEHVFAVDALRQTRPVADQAGLGRTARAANLRGALEARFPLPGWRVVLVDDVVTTGATLAEATRALHHAGATVQATATIAATPAPRRPDGPSEDLTG